jgi:serine/threonine protein kinase
VYREIVAKYFEKEFIFSMATEKPAEHDKVFDYSSEGVRQPRQGGNGIVYYAVRNSDAKPVALKFIPHKNVSTYKDITSGVEIPQEIYWLQKVSQIPGCVKMVEHMKKSDGYIIVMERPELHLDLQQYTFIFQDGIQEVEARVLFRQCVDTLDRLYTAGIVHNDIKPDNLLLDLKTKEVTIIDFGSATGVEEDSLTEFQCTPKFTSPELILTNKWDGIACTVWCLGITLFFIVQKRFPFQSRAEILAGKLHFRSDVSNTLRDLIGDMLNQDPDKRPDFEAIRSHPWMQVTEEEKTLRRCEEVKSCCQQG